MLKGPALGWCSASPRNRRPASQLEAEASSARRWPSARAHAHPAARFAPARLEKADPRTPIKVAPEPRRCLRGPSRLWRRAPDLILRDTPWLRQAPLRERPPPQLPLSPPSATLGRIIDPKQPGEPAYVARRQAAGRVQAASGKTRPSRSPGAPEGGAMNTWPALGKATIPALGACARPWLRGGLGSPRARARQRATCLPSVASSLRTWRTRWCSPEPRRGCRCKPTWSSGRGQRPRPRTRRRLLLPRLAGRSGSGPVSLPPLLCQRLGACLRTCNATPDTIPHLRMRGSLPPRLSRQQGPSPARRQPRTAPPGGQRRGDSRSSCSRPRQESSRRSFRAQVALLSGQRRGLPRRLPRPKARSETPSQPPPGSFASFGSWWQSGLARLWSSSPTVASW